MEAKTDNELIAEFMGKWQVKTDGVIVTDSGDKIGYTDDVTSGCWLVDELCYHTSWNWLMPVVEKISNMGLGPTDNDTATSSEIEEATKQAEVCMLCIDTPIQTVYDTVVGFIKWHNKKMLYEKSI